MYGQSSPFPKGLRMPGQAPDPSDMMGQMTPEMYA